MALSNEVDLEQFNEVVKRVTLNSREVDQLVENLVTEYCFDLDQYMTYIDNILQHTNNPVTDQQLEEFTLNLPSILYFTTSAQEALGIKEDISKAIRNEVYNRVREKAEGTVADKDAAAELQSQAEAIVNIVYSRAYKKVKLRVESAYEMLNSVKKVMTSRISERGLGDK